MAPNIKHDAQNVPLQNRFVVSWFPRASENLPDKDIPAAEFVEAIRKGAYKVKIQAIRERYKRALDRTKGDRGAAKRTVAALKKQLPAVTFSGVFSIRAKDKLTHHSGLLVGDLDAG